MITSQKSETWRSPPELIDREIALGLVAIVTLDEIVDRDLLAILDHLKAVRHGDHINHVHVSVDPTRERRALDGRPRREVANILFSRGAGRRVTEHVLRAVERGECFAVLARECPHTLRGVVDPFRTLAG